MANLADPRCETVGKFPIYHTNCTSFSVCSIKNEALLYYEKKNCDKNVYFNPKIQTCSANYECPDKYCENASTPGTQFVNPNDKEMKSYIICEPDGVASYIPVVKYCPLGEKFVQIHPAILIGSCKKIWIINN